ncbi:hypothetical protein LF1_49940 [Rubripirellula obstinata]|uniref:Uncharacterized protein n=1 Tax=Rubripirellula obstinata TaxID=406547 RepID=A0A5B1CRZ9_9BACT|nr:hypothetical protein LF1_49940 [Rubripirellula obstinata]
MSGKTWRKSTFTPQKFVNSHVNLFDPGTFPSVESRINERIKGFSEFFNCFVFIVPQLSPVAPPTIFIELMVLQNSFVNDVFPNRLGTVLN